MCVVTAGCLATVVLRIGHSPLTGTGMTIKIAKSIDIPLGKENPPSSTCLSLHTPTWLHEEIKKKKYISTTDDLPRTVYSKLEPKIAAAEIFQCHSPLYKAFVNFRKKPNVRGKEPHLAEDLPPPLPRADRPSTQGGQHFVATRREKMSDNNYVSIK